MSCFVTHDRPENTHNRLDVLKMTLKSYSRIKWTEVHLFIGLDEEFKGAQADLEIYIGSLFLGTKLNFCPRRLDHQNEWKPVIDLICEKKEPVWFTQNDDHPFIDIDLDLLNEGLELMQNERCDFKSIYFSHWTEVLKLSGKLGPPKRIGNYIRFECTLIDSIQIFSPAYLKYIFFHIDWGDGQVRRIDTLLRQRALWGASNGNMDTSLQTVFVPLREFCRKFAGYGHVFMEDVAGLELTGDMQNLKSSRSGLRTLMTAKHKSMWTDDNHFEVPDDWFEISCKLYGLSSSGNSRLRQSRRRLLNGLRKTLFFESGPERTV